MGSIIEEVLPVAVGMVLVNPIPMMAVILILLSPNARSTAPAFVAGWLLGMGVVVGILLLVVPPEATAAGGREPSTIASVLKLLLGLVLLGLAVKQWRSRPAPGADRELPSWMTTLDEATPAAALRLGAFLSGANPKVLAFNAAAVVAIVPAGLPIGQQLAMSAIYVLLASAGVAAPAIWYFVAHDSAVKTLAGWRVWLMSNYATMMAIVLLLFGAILFSKGLGPLIG